MIGPVIPFEPPEIPGSAPPLPGLQGLYTNVQAATTPPQGQSFMGWLGGIFTNRGRAAVEAGRTGQLPTPPNSGVGSRSWFEGLANSLTGFIARGGWMVIGIILLIGGVILLGRARR